MEDITRQTGEISFRVDFDGRWYGPDGKEVNEASLFFLTQNLRWDKEGFFIGMGFGPAKLIVEDVPLHVRGLDLVKKGEARHLTMTLLGGATEVLNPETLHKRGEHFYCRVRGGNIPARFIGSAVDELTKHLKEEGEDIYLVL
ncbi:MAG: hypothetical protein JW984_08630 [Deltaproteobacteria bacterium]|uniref:DUF1285 domain-containing protein n=1 Tax=Candidatus Zymogenus saltonus TaxID=2844893 RepID=A0A9D8PP96_9DELT|nr:hypothetical protein [Candidatus Zymogenus saltonus]